MTTRMPSVERAGSGLINPLPENLFRRPIDYLQADHRRILRVCDLLDSLVVDPRSDASFASANIALAYLRADLPLHIADEEDLFHRLAACFPPSDRVESLIETLEQEHGSNAVLLERTEAALSFYEAGSAPDDIGPAVATFAEAKRQHVRLENERLLPLARDRLGADDCEAFGRSMALRRRVPYPE